MTKYVYLPEGWMICTWTDGGQLPIRPASTYLANERRGQLTPDECRVLQSTVPMEVVEAELPDFLDPRGSYAGIGFEGNVDEHGRPLRDFYIDKHRIEEGLVLCLANSLSGHIASSFGRQFCVAIDDVERLKHHLDQQLGTVSQMRACDYTVDHNRNHFLKAIDDAWQDEFRMFWPIADGSRSVTLEAGTGTVVAIPASIEMTDEEASRITRLRAESEIAAQRNNAPRPRVPDEVLRAIGWIK